MFYWCRMSQDPRQSSLVPPGATCSTETRVCAPVLTAGPDRRVWTVGGAGQRRAARVTAPRPRGGTAPWAWPGPASPAHACPSSCWPWRPSRGGRGVDPASLRHSSPGRWSPSSSCSCSSSSLSSQFLLSSQSSRLPRGGLRRPSCRPRLSWQQPDRALRLFMTPSTPKPTLHKKTWLWRPREQRTLTSSTLKSIPNSKQQRQVNCGRIQNKQDQKNPPLSRFHCSCYRFRPSPDARSRCWTLLRVSQLGIWIRGLKILQHRSPRRQHRCGIKSDNNSLELHSLFLLIGGKWACLKPLWIFTPFPLLNVGLPFCEYVAHANISRHNPWRELNINKQTKTQTTSLQVTPKHFKMYLSMNTLFFLLLSGTVYCRDCSYQSEHITVFICPIRREDWPHYRVSGPGDSIYHSAQTVRLNKKLQNIGPAPAPLGHHQPAFIPQQQRVTPQQQQQQQEMRSLHRPTPPRTPQQLIYSPHQPQYQSSPLTCDMTGDLTASDPIDEAVRLLEHSASLLH